MKIKELIDLSESDRLSDDQKECISEILTAINDWPESIDDLDSIKFKIHYYIGVSDIKTLELKAFINSLDPKHQAWYKESLQGFLNVLEKSNCSTIEDVFERIKSW